MNTNKFLLGGLVAIIAIVSVQISNQLQIQDLIEKIDSVAIPQQAAVVTAVETKTSVPTLSENTCLKSTITQSFGTNMKQVVDQKISLTATCDKTTVNELIIGFSSIKKDSLKNLQIKDGTTGKIYPLEFKDGEDFVDNGSSFGAVSKMNINSSFAKNTSRTFSLVSPTADVQMYIMGTTVTTNGASMLISYSDYTSGNGDTPAPTPIWLLNWRCKRHGGPWTANNGTYTCTDAAF